MNSQNWWHWKVGDEDKILSFDSEPVALFGGHTEHNNFIALIDFQNENAFNSAGTKSFLNGFTYCTVMSKSV